MIAWRSLSLPEASPPWANSTPLGDSMMDGSEMQYGVEPFSLGSDPWVWTTRGKEWLHLDLQPPVWA